jgi:membrane associated rhomboid family serine protease
VIPFKDNIPTDATPFVTLALIAANVVFYVVVALHGGSLISGPDAQELAKYGAIPAALTWDRVFTSMFMHASILQLVGNMAFLWWFGNTIEDAVGAVRFFGIYLVGGVCAVALQVAVDPDSMTTLVGAGGAIAAVLGGYTVLYRGARMLTLVLIPLLFTVIEVPALVMLALWFAMQAAFAATGLINGAAYVGEIGAFLLGALTIRFLATNRKPVPPTRVVS